MIEEKCCCSNEPQGTIPILRIIEKLDALFARNNMQEVGRVLRYWEGEARALKDNRGLCEILSEEIGYFRKIGDATHGLEAVDEALSLLCCMDECVSTATIYLNCATTMKAFGKAKEAMPYYEKAQDIYERLLPKDDYRLAGLYNNFATALGDLKEFAKARENYQKAIDLLKSKVLTPELAVSYVNLAHLLDDEGQFEGKDFTDEIDELLDLAYACLDDNSLERDGNYAYVCSKCAPAFGYFGYFLQKAELEQRADAIYSGDKG